MSTKGSKWRYPTPNQVSRTLSHIGNQGFRNRVSHVRHLMMLTRFCMPDAGTLSLRASSFGLACFMLGQGPCDLTSSHRPPPPLRQAPGATPSRLGRAIHGPMPVYGGNFWRTFRTIGPYEFPRKRYGPLIGPYEFPQEKVWTNGPQSSLKVSVLTGIGP